ncbi:dnaJ -like protein [Brachionus plicatilis]|uniref:DnaJ-like protein n=1 Tax=Brachionus plicatilis TaxID=10195 RepID=A0A3M7RI71_BRAPC|nr:dnaJ -like protein [Brachionus plicatilis]
MNAYEILECERSSTQEQIKQSYHRLLLIYHPDKNLGSEKPWNKFLQLQSAYKILSNAFERKTYDSILKQQDLKKKSDDFEHFENDEENLFVSSLKKDFEFDSNSGEYTRSCRCGSIYRFNQKHLNEILIKQSNNSNSDSDSSSVTVDSFILGLECDSCSLSNFMLKKFH